MKYTFTYIVEVFASAHFSSAVVFTSPNSIPIIYDQNGSVEVFGQSPDFGDCGDFRTSTVFAPGAWLRVEKTTIKEESKEV